MQNNSKKIICDYLSTSSCRNAAVILGILGAVMIALTPLSPAIGFIGMLMLFSCLCTAIGAFLLNRRMHKTIRQLEKSGLLDKAAHELDKEPVKIFGDNNVYVSENFVFSIAFRRILPIEDILLCGVDSSKTLYQVYAETQAGQTYTIAETDTMKEATQLAELLCKQNPHISIGMQSDKKQ